MGFNLVPILCPFIAMGGRVHMQTPVKGKYWVLGTGSAQLQGGGNGVCC